MEERGPHCTLIVFIDDATGRLTALRFAPAPQAKGRVERANQTLQDRLIKEMRRAEVCDIAGAQALAQDFIETWNTSFARAPMEEADAHRPWTKGAKAFDEALARREQRTLSKALTFSAAGKVLCVKTNGPGTALRGARMTLLHFQDGRVRTDYKNRSLPYTHVKTRPGPGPGEDEKSLDALMAGIAAANTATAPP